MKGKIGNHQQYVCFFVDRSGHVCHYPCTKKLAEWEFAEPALIKYLICIPDKD